MLVYEIKSESTRSYQSLKLAKNNVSNFFVKLKKMMIKIRKKIII